MGTINYGSNDILNIGTNASFAVDDDYMLLLLNDFTDTLEDYTFQYFTMEIKCGYYDGLYLDITDGAHWYSYFDDQKERQEAIQEVKLLEELLKRLIFSGMVVYAPGWCTSYLTEGESVKECEKAMKDLKRQLLKTPTWRTYNRLQQKEA